MKHEAEMSDRSRVIEHAAGEQSRRGILFSFSFSFLCYAVEFINHLASHPLRPSHRNRSCIMVLADLGQRLSSALGQLSKASVVDDKVRFLPLLAFLPD